MALIDTTKKRFESDIKAALLSHRQVLINVCHIGAWNKSNCKLDNVKGRISTC